MGSSALCEVIIQEYIHSVIDELNKSYVYLFIDLFIHPLIHLFISSLIQSYSLKNVISF